ncbi:MAG: serine hydrolase [Chitinophagaceae bacterium]
MTDNSQKNNEAFLKDLMNEHPIFFDSILKEKKDLNVQVIYTQIDRKQNGDILFADHFFNVDNENYFYPASTIKLPVAILALQKLNELNIAGLDMNTTMITEAEDENQSRVYNDPTTADGRPTIAHYIKKILLVSDNDAFNRLYEFLGQEYIHKSLHKLGYSDVQIIHRLEVSLTEEQNRHTNPIIFMDTSGVTIYEQAGAKSKLEYASRNTKLGRGYMRGNELVKHPFEFSKKNRLSLQDLHNILRSVIFPQSVSKDKLFNLNKQDYVFLQKYMSMFPKESSRPYYGSSVYNDVYVKFLLYGAGQAKSEPGIRIFNKVGDAYGFLTDAAFVVDFEKKIEFFLSATIYCNSDGIFNDDKYDYDSLGFPFLKNLGRIVYEYELRRKRTIVSDLSPFQFNYKSYK